MGLMMVGAGDYPAYTKIQTHLLHASSTPLRNVPIRLYVPSSAVTGEGGGGAGSFRVVQTLVAPRLGDRGFFLLLGLTHGTEADMVGDQRRRRPWASR